VRVLVLNAGSSSLKASVIESGRREPLASASVGWGSDATRITHGAATVIDVLDYIASGGVERSSLQAVGHRFVHGGPSFRSATPVDEGVLVALEQLVDLAPLHNRVALDTIITARRLLAGIDHVCAFDSGFHSTLPPAAYVYPLPWSWYEKWGIRRYGFHGLSVAWAVRRAGELLGRDPASLRLIVAHLGSGCSVTAVDGGISSATSMGLTPLEGLMMGTRAGSFDPGIVIGLLREGRLTLDELAEAVDHGSGLLGVSGVSGDVRAVTEAASRGVERARLALDIFVRRAAEGIAAAASSLSRLDALVFSGGIGENAGELRARIVERLAVLGVAPVDSGDTGADGILSDGSSPVAVLRVEAREDLVIAEEVQALLA
jgi:acetate kinase